MKFFLMTMLVLVFCIETPEFAQTATQSVSHHSISKAINTFVAALYPRGSHYFWVINDTTTESKHEMVVDINTTLQGDANEDTNQQRFLLLLIDGKLFAAHKIPLDATVNCKQEEEV